MRASKRLCERLALTSRSPLIRRPLPRSAYAQRGLFLGHPRLGHFNKLSSNAPVTVIRWNSSLTAPQRSEQDTSTSQPAQTAPPPSYALTFTCKPCGHRSSHRVTKQGYHHGTVLIQCQQCKNRHLISDHLKIFMDEQSTLEDILRRKHGDLSKLLKRGKLGMRQGAMVGNEGDEDMEFWEDGTESHHSANTDPTQSQKENLA